MSGTYDNEMTGIISKNTRKDSDKHPDIKGQGTINGAEVWIDGWLKQRKDGTGTFYSLRFKLKDGQSFGAGGGNAGSGQRQSTYSSNIGADLNDDIPF